MNKLIAKGLTLGSRANVLEPNGFFLSLVQMLIGSGGAEGVRWVCTHFPSSKIKCSFLLKYSLTVSMLSNLDIII